jgi:prepilin-type processing-associated H-X9-DG protein/prepilin-type N-terminal cleavage/methylation domain-containing protein
MKIQLAVRNGKAFTLIEILVVIFVLAMMAAMLQPAFHHAKRHSGISCVSILKQDSFSFRIWAGDNGDKYPMQVSLTNGGAMESILDGNVAQVFRVMSNELSDPKALICPSDTEHTNATNFSTDFDNSKISYFVGVDASENFPQTILSGDDNLAVAGKSIRHEILDLSTNSPVTWRKERHGGTGNYLLADGSVQQGASDQFKSSFTNGTGNRLAIP